MSRTLATVIPFRDFERIAEDMDRAFSALWGGHRATPSLAGAAFAPVDIFEQEGRVVFRAAVPGLAPEEVEVTVEDNILNIRGEFKQAWEGDENATVYRRESRTGAFSRSFQLPENLDVENVDATFSNGVVSIAIPIRVEPKPEPKRIELKQTNP